MSKATRLLAIASCGIFVLAAPAFAASPARLALVIGETTYAALPPLPACAGSARSVAAALRHSGFEVTQRLDATNGEIDAALSGFGKRLAETSGATAVIYFCGYAAGLNGRSFLLPVTATIERPFDVLTQGIVAQSALHAVTSATAGGLLALDVFAQPGTTTPPPLERLTQGTPLTTHGYVAVAEPNPADAATPLASALASGLAAPTVETASLVGDLPHRLSPGSGAKLIAAQAPTATSFLAGAPPPEPAPPPKQATQERPPSPPAASPPQPAPPPKQATQEPASPPAAPPPPAPPAAVPPSPPPAATVTPPVPTMPPEEQMTEADRRRVQAALAVLGYYDGRIDGQFGAETRAAIRRFQHEIGANMTGHLTPEQAGRLVAGRS